MRRIPVLGSRLRGALEAGSREAALDAVGASLRAVGSAVRGRAADAHVLFVDYLTLLPPSGESAAPLSQSDRL